MPYQVGNKVSYIDPGAGGIVIYSLWPLIVAIFLTIAGFIVKRFLEPIKRMFLKVMKREEVPLGR